MQQINHNVAFGNAQHRASAKRLLKTLFSFICFDVLDNVKARALNLVWGKMNIVCFNQTPVRLGSLSASFENSLLRKGKLWELIQTLQV